MPHVTSEPQGTVSLCAQALGQEAQGGLGGRDAHCCPWSALDPTFLGLRLCPCQPVSSRCTGPGLHTLPTLSRASHSPCARFLHGVSGPPEGLAVLWPHDNPDLGLNRPWSFSLRKFDQPFSKRVEPSLMQASFLYKVHCVFFEVFVFVFNRNSDRQSLVCPVRATQMCLMDVAASCPTSLPRCRAASSSSCLF